MRFCLWLVLVAGCTEHGQTPPVPDAPPDAATFPDAAVCNPSGDCALGPACGTLCCGTGERCVQGVCMCGTQPACEPGDTCNNSGPVLDTFCGGFCCGEIHGCPI